MQYTGERYMPLIEKPGHPGIAFHNERYEFAALFCHGKDVLEVGCGAGYGAAILANRAGHVDAFDYSPEAVEYCKEHYPLANINFFTEDVHAYQVSHDCYDVVVAYEVIEHIHDGNILLELMKKAMKPFSGMGFVSTPAPVAHGSGFHVHEYDLPEFEELLASHFREYVILSHRPGTFSLNLKDAHTYIAVVYNG